MNVQSSHSAGKISQPTCLLPENPKLSTLPWEILGMILEILPKMDRANASLVCKRLRRVAKCRRIFPKRAEKLRIFHNMIKGVYALRNPSSEEQTLCQKIRKNYADEYLKRYNEAIASVHYYDRHNPMRAMSLNAAFHASMQCSQVHKIHVCVSPTFFHFFFPKVIQVDFKGRNGISPLYSITIPSKSGIQHIAALSFSKLYARDNQGQEFIIDFSVRTDPLKVSARF